MADQTNSHVALEQALLALDDRAMVLEELDGFIAGLLILPEQVPPGEWFAVAFGLGKGQRTVFASIDHANAVLDLVRAYHDAIARTLARTPELYQPRFPVDPDTGDVVWELWIDGFARATDLRRQRFDAYELVGGEVAIAALGLITMIGATLDDDPDPVEYRNLSRNAPRNIRDAVLTLYQYRNSGGPLPGTPSFEDIPNPFASLAKTGRNDLCPCGSGRKFKRCCGAN
ncbi:putative transporter (YecA family protein with SEC-C motif)) [Bradyrhizobium sp. ORS 285]|uniref:UPF0149 family protein n=1 Tax=Bradyrhizobium sp. ORS 285 TaxID=115808 RepID=UPI0002406DD7|nr:UPF0149 family protein [Bradyrhizobium sp. ORS 285]CCD88974.1 putative transporter (YecA family protein with SEC-C motif)) [Bradyrhizobium sp. ORS 285]SMX58364.1 putative transporter (YecA family protein with SEC-C motif)) [Bradyrhizobium sp. ORS 285]